MNEELLKERWKYLLGHIPTKIRTLEDSHYYLLELIACIKAIDYELFKVKDELQNKR